MLLRESRITALIYLTACLLAPQAFAQTEMNSFSSGNVIGKPETIERLVRMSIADVLNARFSGTQLKFVTPRIDQRIQLQKSTTQTNEILQSLGIKTHVNVTIDPIAASFTLPASALKIDITKVQPNRFQVKAKWSVTQASATVKRLGIQVPAGVFEKPFEIVSTPIQIGLAPKSKPISIEITLITDLSDSGTQIDLTDFRTNLGDTQGAPTFFVKLGQLTVGGKPLELEIMSNGKTLLADEPTIRAQFQTLEPGLVQSIQSQLREVIEQHVDRIATSIEKAPPIKFGFDTTPLVQKLDKKPDTQKLLKDIKFDFFVSYLQYVDRYKLFSAQVSSNVCVDTHCLTDNTKASPIGVNDLKSVGANDELGIIVYESWLQNFVHSSVVQDRIRQFYSTIKIPGIELGKQGLRVHLSPERNALVIVANVEIDIKKTKSEDNKFSKRFRRSAGDLIEYLFGSGKVVKLPIEITAKFNGFKTTREGQPALSILTTLPFQDGKVTNTYKYTSNVPEMKEMVRKGLLQTLAEELAENIPNEFLIPLKQPIEVAGYQFNFNKAEITTNHGLLVTGKIIGKAQKAPKK